MWYIVLPIILGIIAIAIFIFFFWIKGILQGQMLGRSPEEIRLEGGEKRALLLYHPTRHDTGTAYARLIADGLHARGYDVTVNFASKELNYNLEDFELLILGTGAYIGTAATPIRRWMHHNPFHRKQVVLYSVGSNLTQDPEITQMFLELQVDNIVYRIKVSKNQEDVLQEFVDALELDDPDFDSLPDPDEEPFEPDFDENSDEGDQTVENSDENLND